MWYFKCIWSLLPPTWRLPTQKSTGASNPLMCGLVSAWLQERAVRPGTHALWHRFDIFWSTTKLPLTVRSLSETKNPFLKGQVSPGRERHDAALTQYKCLCSSSSLITPKEVQRRPSKGAAWRRPLLPLVQTPRRALPLPTSQIHRPLQARKEVIISLPAGTRNFSEQYWEQEKYGQIVLEIQIKKPHTEFNPMH